VGPKKPLQLKAESVILLTVSGLLLVFVYWIVLGNRVEAGLYVIMSHYISCIFLANHYFQNEK